MRSTHTNPKVISAIQPPPLESFFNHEVIALSKINQRGGRAARQKGNRGEREVVELMRAIDSEAKRVPFSGAVKGYPGDVELPNKGWLVEVKRRNHGFQLIENWIKDVDLVAFRRDRGEWMVAMRLEDFINEITGTEGNNKSQ